MPRNGDGSSDNGPFEAAGHNIIHGAGKVEVRLASNTSQVASLHQHVTNQTVYTVRPRGPR